MEETGALTVTEWYGGDGSFEYIFCDLHAASDTERGKAEAVFFLMKFIDSDGVMKDCKLFLKSSPDPATFIGCFRRVLERLQNSTLNFMLCVLFLKSSSDPAKFIHCVGRVREFLESEKLLNLNFMLPSLIEIGGGDQEGYDGCIKMLYWRTVHPKGFVNFSDPFVYMVLCDRETHAQTIRRLSREVGILEQQIQAAEDWIAKAIADADAQIRLISHRCTEHGKRLKRSNEYLSSLSQELGNEILHNNEKTIQVIQKIVQKQENAVTGRIQQIRDEISADRGRGENPALGQGDPRPAARGDFWKPLITAAGTLASILGLYVASIIWEEDKPYSGLYMAAMILLLYATLYFYPTVKQYGILRRRLSTCHPELQGPLKFQMLTIDIKTICVAALTCTVLYHSLLMYECYDERHAKHLLPS